MSESITIRIPNNGVLTLARGNSVHLLQNPVFNDIMLLAGNQPWWWKNSHCINQQKLQIKFNFVLGRVCVCQSMCVCVFVLPDNQFTTMQLLADIIQKCLTSSSRIRMHAFSKRNKNRQAKLCRIFLKINSSTFQVNSLIFSPLGPTLNTHVSCSPLFPPLLCYSRLYSTLPGQPSMEAAHYYFGPWILHQYRSSTVLF